MTVFKSFHLDCKNNTKSNRHDKYSECFVRDHFILESAKLTIVDDQENLVLKYEMYKILFYKSN